MVRQSCVLFSQMISLFYSSHFTLFLLTADSTTQYELHQLAQFSDVSHLPDKVHVWHVHIRYLVVEHLFMEGEERIRIE